MSESAVNYNCRVTNPSTTIFFISTIFSFFLFFFILSPTCSRPLHFFFLVHVSCLILKKYLVIKLKLFIYNNPPLFQQSLSLSLSPAMMKNQGEIDWTRSSPSKSLYINKYEPKYLKNYKERKTSHMYILLPEFEIFCLKKREYAGVVLSLSCSIAN